MPFFLNIFDIFYIYPQNPCATRAKILSNVKQNKNEVCYNEQNSAYFVLLYEVKMDELTKLIKEAKPLYKARKRRKNFLVALFALFIPMSLLSFSFGIYQAGSNIYLSIANENFTQELVQDEFNLYQIK